MAELTKIISLDSKFAKQLKKFLFFVCRFRHHDGIGIYAKLTIFFTRSSSDSTMFYFDYDGVYWCRLLSLSLLLVVIMCFFFSLTLFNLLCFNALPSFFCSIFKKSVLLQLCGILYIDVDCYLWDNIISCLVILLFPCACVFFVFNILGYLFIRICPICWFHYFLVSLNVSKSCMPHYFLIFLLHYCSR